jgi:hypothetical protein
MEKKTREQVLALERIYNKKHPLQRWLYRLRGRAKEKQLEFNLTEDDLVVPAVCPILNIPLKKAYGLKTDNSPTVDRIRNDQGYVPGNIRIVSHRANRLKADANIAELIDIILYMVKHENNNEKTKTT